MKTLRITGKNPLAKSFAEPFSADDEIEYRKLIVVEELLQHIKRNGIKRTELAKRMGVVPSRITKMLDGTENLTIDTLVRAGIAVGAELYQTYAPKGHKVRWQSYNPNSPNIAMTSINFPKTEKIDYFPTPLLANSTIANKDDEYAA